MDKNQIKTKSDLLDLKLVEELEKIDADFESRGLASSGSRLRARGRAKIKSQLEKELLSSGSENESGKLVFYKDGSVHYVALSGQTYKAKFKLGTNSYKLLHYLADNSGSVFSYSDLVKKINVSRQGAEATDETRIRDTIQIIRRELGLTKENKIDDLFRVDGKHFGVKFNAEIKQSP